MIKKNKISKLLIGNRIEAASTLPKSKYIAVFDGNKNSYIPKTKENLEMLNKKFGAPSKYDYRGKNRTTWVDKSIYR